MPLNTLNYFTSPSDYFGHFLCNGVVINMFLVTAESWERISVFAYALKRISLMLHNDLQKLNHILYREHHMVTFLIIPDLHLSSCLFFFFSCFPQEREYDRHARRGGGRPAASQPGSPWTDAQPVQQDEGGGKSLAGRECRRFPQLSVTSLVFLCFRLN